MNIMKNTMATEGQKKRREAQQQLAGEVKNLMGHSEHEGLCWQGTRIDLMEALHLAYETGSLHDEQGICLSFSTIVCRACRVLHVSCPRNPYECAARGKRRKGMLMNTFMCRYERQMQASEHTNILWRNISGQPLYEA